MTEEANAEHQPLTRVQQIEKDLVAEQEANKVEDSSKPTDEPAAPTPTPEQEAGSEEEIPEESASEEDVVEQEEKQKKPKKGLTKRFSELTHRNKELAAQLEQAQALLRERESQKPAEIRTNDSLEAPKIDDFETYADYNRALIKFEAKQIREEERKQEAVYRQQQVLTEATIKFQEGLEKVAEENADFYEVFDPDLRMSPPMEGFLLESEAGAKIAYYLCKNQTEASKIATMPPIQAVKALTLIESRLTESSETPAQEQKVSKAPAPVKPSSGTSGKSTGIPEDFDDFKKWYKKTYNRR